MKEKVDNMIDILEEVLEKNNETRALEKLDKVIDKRKKKKEDEFEMIDC